MQWREAPIDPKQPCGQCSLGLRALDSAHYLPCFLSGLFLGIINTSEVLACLEFLSVGSRRASWEVNIELAHCWGSEAGETV